MLLKAGLCGNYVNSKKIEGFNSVDLQHAVILIDKESNEINRPPQLIQGAGRLRCLNPLRLSTLFCESSEKLKFDINLLEKGDYLDQYNKALEEDKKRTTEEAGDTILQWLDDCIKTKAGEIARKTNPERVSQANELAKEVISEVISSFEKVYNDKRHNAKEAQDYFTEVLEYVTSKVEEQLKENNIIVGKFDIEYDIRSIESKVAKNNDAIKDKNKKVTELQFQAQETDSSLKDIQTKITELLKKISQNLKEQKEVDERLEIKGNVIEKLFIKLYRLVRRLIFCRIELEKQKIKLEEEGYKLKQEKNQENRNKIEKEAEKVKLANEEEKLKKEKEQIAKKSTILEQEKEGLEKKLEPEKKKFLKLVEQIKDRKNREITQEEKQRIINEHKQTLTKDISNKDKELEKSKEDAQKLLCDFLRDVSKKLIKHNAISTLILQEIAEEPAGEQEESAIGRAVAEALEEIKQEAVGKLEDPLRGPPREANMLGLFGNLFKEIIEILKHSTTKDIDESLQEVTDKIKEGALNYIHDLEQGQEREDDVLNKMSSFEKEAKELTDQKAKFAEKKAELEKNKEYAKDFLGLQPTSEECKKYCNNIVNKELLKGSVKNNYSPEQITWITEVFEDFNKVFKTEDYNNNLQYGDQHIEDCKKSQVFLELFNNTFVPLMNAGYLLIALNVCYPKGGNQEREYQIRSCYNKLTNNKVNEVNNHDIECVMSYIEKIQDHLKALDVKFIMSYIKEIQDHLKAPDIKFIMSYIEKIQDHLKILGENSSLNKHDVKNVMSYIEKIQDRLKALGENSPLNKDDVKFIMSYTEKIQDHLKALGENSSLHHKSAFKNAKLEIERLKNKEELQIKSEIHDCVLTKIKEGFSQFIDDVQREDIAQLEKIASAARKVGTDLKDVKPLTFGEIISPNTRFLNPLAKLQENKYVGGQRC